MAKFASSSKQALTVIKDIQENGEFGNSSVNGFKDTLKVLQDRYEEYFQAGYLNERLGSLQELTIDQAKDYLALRACDVEQKTLDHDRHTIQAMFHFSTNKLSLDKALSVVKSENDNKQLSSRVYTSKQIESFVNHQREANALATEIASFAGLRAHEILTISRPSEQPITARFYKEPAQHKFKGLNGVKYTVQGKGGLIREIVISHELAKRLENLRLDNSRTVVDRKINYTQRYDISGGQKWSNSFSAASNRALGWSRGAHGVRHSYAQRRVLELQKRGISPSEAKRTASQEMGHFRASIIEVYLR